MNFSYKQIWLIAYPILISLLMEHMINVTDTAFLGHVGEVELGASALAGVLYMAILAEELFVQTYKRLLDIYCKTPTELYVDLVRRYPDFLNYITLREIASFLRVTPETISHIRKNTKGIEFC